MVRMHPDEVATDVALVRALLRAQLPQWADLPLAPVESFGTDHDIYRLGDAMVVRLPRIGWATEQAAKEGEWLPRFAPHLPLAVPAQLALGRPGEGYPYVWSVCSWLPGESAVGGIRDLEQAAVDLAGFVRALRSVETGGAPPRAAGARGAPLVELDAQVRRSVDALGGRVDADAALACWEASLAAAPWSGPDVWVHGDLLPGNLLVVDGRLSGVIDFGGLNVGDPACDLQPAWNVFDVRSRQRFLRELDVDEPSMLRGRGWTLYQALSALPYYWDSNPGIVRQARHALSQVLGDEV